MSASSRFSRLWITLLKVGFAFFLLPLPAAGLLPAAPEVQAQVLTTETTAATQPEPLDDPLSISASLSTVQAGGILAVTYTVHNDLGPDLRPAASPGDPTDDIVAAIEATDFADDPNVIHDTLLTINFTHPDAGLLSASHPAGRDGDWLSFNLGDILPLGSATLVLTTTLPATVGDFTDLDSGASAYGNWRGRAVTAAAAPLRLAPDGFAQWLVCTPDANCLDPYVTRQAAALGHDPTAIFEFVRSHGYESYPGSLRGARGTLWSEAGNGYDQSSLLIALLRASGVPAAYRQGTLDQGHAQTLIASMFPEVTAPSGLLPAGADTAEPENDPATIAEAQVHAWAEAYLPGSGWTALDPAFPTAQPGDTFGSPTSGQLAELPDAVRHKVTVELELEKYSAFPIGGSYLYTLNPLAATFNTVELVGEPLVFAHLVHTDDQSGLAYSTVQHTYTPYFVAGTSEDLVEGETFSELISNFPFGQDFVTAEWLDFTITGPTTEGGSQSETYRRELFDDIGYQARVGGGTVDQLQRDSTARVSLMSSWTTLVVPSVVPVEAVNDAYQEMVALSLDSIAVADAAAAMTDNPNPTQEQIDEAQAALITLGKMARLAQRLHLFKFAAASQQAHDYLADALLVKTYADTPRLFTVGWERNDQTQTDNISFDLLSNRVRATAYPGQTEIGLEGFRYWRALLDMAVEHEVLAELAPEPLVSVGAVLNEAQAQGIPLERITMGTLDKLAALPLSDQAKARITTALSDDPDQYIIVPAQMVTLAGAAEPTVGWLRVHNQTLEVIDTMENGQHTVAVNYAALAEYAQKAGSLVGGFTAAFFGHTMGFWIGFFEQMPLGDQDIGRVIRSAKETADQWGKDAENACNEKADEEWCKRGVALGNMAGAAVLAEADPPLQETLFVLPMDPPDVDPQVSVQLSEAASLPAGNVEASVTTPLVGVHGTAAHDWTSAAENSFSFDTLSVPAADVYANGVLVGSGPLAASPISDEPALAGTDGSAVDVDGAATGSLSLHAPALAGLAAGSQFQTYGFDLSAPSTYTLTLSGATAIVDGSIHQGDLEMVVTGTATLNGSGSTAGPSFAGSATFAPSGGGFTVAGASGSLTVGGAGVDAGNGFALGNANSPATVTPSGADDLFAFGGPADFFALDLDSYASSVASGAATGFDAGVLANFADTYALQVRAPHGWDLTVDGAGQVTAWSTAGALPGAYSILVTAQSSIHPDLFVSAVHVVTLTSVDGVTVDVTPDPVYTVPWGPYRDVINFDTTVGRVQIPGAAFAIAVQNTSTTARTFDVDVSGLPAGWSILGALQGGTHLQVPLAAGERARLGLYIQPDTGVLPAPGSAYPFLATATATDNPGVSAAGAETFTMPSLPYPALSVAPAELYAGENSDVAFDLTLTNVGNAAGTFELLSTVPVDTWSVSGLGSGVFLNPGEFDTQTVTVTVNSGQVGVDHPVAIGSPAPTVPYTPTVAANVYIAGQYSLPIFQAARGCVLGSASLAAALETLALAVSDLEASCATGECSLDDRDRVVDAIRSTASYAESASGGAASTAALDAIADALSGHTEKTAIETDLANLAAAVEALALELCELEQHRPAARFTPYFSAVLVGQPTALRLDVTNQGTVATTYAVTVTTPSGDQIFNPVVGAGATVSLPVNTTPFFIDTYDLTAQVVAVAPDIRADVRAEAQGLLNAVDRFLQVTRVSADPDFVETGVSSTTLSVEVDNVAGAAQQAKARASILAPGGSLTWTMDVPLTILIGDPRTYELATVDSSGWAEGTYTVTLDLLDAGDGLIPNGDGHGYFAVGQGLVSSHAVSPLVVPPGDVTVTTVITTELKFEPTTIEPLRLTPSGDDPQPEPRREPAGDQPAAVLLSEDAAPSTIGAGPDPSEWAVPTVDATASPLSASAARPLSPPAPAQHEGAAAGIVAPLSIGAAEAALAATDVITISGIFTRTEQSDPSINYTGTWTAWNLSRASGGNYLRADTAGETAEFTFSGSAVRVGFMSNRYSGHAGVSIDGVDQGVADLYRREESVISFVYDGLITGTHTISVTALGTSNPFASNENVQLDYFDAWKDSPLPHGTFQEDDPRVILSSSWHNLDDTIANGGSLYYSNQGTAWFPFWGDSFTYHLAGRAGNGWTRLFVDGEYLTDMQPWHYSYSIYTDTYSFEGFGPGSHLLQVDAVRGNTTIDAFVTPGTPPFDEPGPVGAYTRFEEDHPAWLFNGVPFTRTAPSWSRSNAGAANRASGDQAIGSDTAADTASVEVDGSWLGLGLATSSGSGTADIYLDGAFQRTVHLYRHDYGVTSEFFPALSAGPHTISVTVVGDGDVWIDYVDVWDGTALPDGEYRDFPGAGRLYHSSGWTYSTLDDYLYAGEGTVWFPFTGNSVSYRALARSNVDKAKLFIDDQYQGVLDLFSTSTVTRTFSFDGLGTGVHLLRLESYRDNVTLDAFAAPRTSPVYTPTVDTGIIRYEEDHPALLYNGLPFTQTATSWTIPGLGKTYPSEGRYAYSKTASDTVSLTFDGSWFGVGFLTKHDYGIADIYLDGSLLETVDLYTRHADTKSLYFDGLPDQPHTISVTVRGERHPNSAGDWVSIDYFDVWDGTPEVDGTYQESDRERLIYGTDWYFQDEPAAGGGGYANDGNGDDSTVWFPFHGDSVSYVAWAHRQGFEVEIKIDGTSYGPYGRGLSDIYSEVPISRTFSFDGLGDGPHVMEVRAYRGDTTVDAFIAPGVPPFYVAPPAATGIVRYEEDHPALRYNGYPFEQTEYCFLNCWGMPWWRTSSNAYIAESRRPGDWVELTFDGTWAGVGFAVRPDGGTAEIFIDGTSMMTLTHNTGQDVVSVYFDDLVSGTHTISVSLLSGRLFFDFFDVWDGAEMGDGWFEADLEQHRGPFYFTHMPSWYTVLPSQSFAERMQFARDKDALGRRTISYSTHMWFGFTGDDLLFLPFQKAGEWVEVFIDGISHGVVDLTPEFTSQPIAIYYTGLGDGPHMVRLNAVSGPWIDAFQVDPPDLLPYTPVVEWWDPAPTDYYTDTVANYGLVSTAAIGDLDGDGLVEIVAPSSNGYIYVYRGDGQDTGGGSPLLWKSDLISAAAEPSLADLDGDGDAEIVVVGTAGTAAFHHDSSIYWLTDTIKSSIEQASWGGSSIGNLDAEPGPEIALATHNGTFYVLDHDGTILFSEPTGSFPAVPALADLTGDGRLDIILAQERTITVYDPADGYSIAWTRTHTYTHTGPYGQAFGGPAVVDVDGKQPGGDDGPEVIINWGHYVEALDHDGQLMWNHYMGTDTHYRPSPITVADVDGDNEIEILTASAIKSGFFVWEHTLVVLNADGTLLWQQSMGDTTHSASGVATHDLDGDGVWEVLWNGYNEGFTLMDGPTGEKFFNEELTESGTFVDYPVVGDVDGDGYAEVVTGGNNGLYVIGHDQVWGDSRPLWNQHHYHITNVNDDLSIPINEPNSWDLHNTYHTQTQDRNPMPSSSVILSHTVGPAGVTVLTSTFNVTPGLQADPLYRWSYTVDGMAPIVTRTFDLHLADMQPGESRLVAEGTEVAYTLLSGQNRLYLPPLYVSAPHIVSVSPSEARAAAGGAVEFGITLSNPSLASSDTYSLALSGIPGAWATYPVTVSLAAGAKVTVPLTVTIPAGTLPDTLPVIVDVSSTSAATDQVAALLSVVDGVDLAIQPSHQTASPGQPVTYTLTITNNQAVERTYTLSATGPAGVVLPPPVSVGPGGVHTVQFTASSGEPGPHPFTITARGSGGAADSTDAVLDVPGGPFAALTLLPDPAVTGAGATASMTLTVINAGDLPGAFDLNVAVPAGWSYALQSNGQPVSGVDLPPELFNTSALSLLVTPDGSASTGDYPVTVTAGPQGYPAATAMVTATVQIVNLGVDVEILPPTTSLSPQQVGQWDVRVTNTGQVADAFDLQAAGLLALSGAFSHDSVALASGESQIVQLTSNTPDQLPPQTYAVVVAAVSQTDGRISDQDQTTVTFTSYDGVDVAWRPLTQTVTGTLEAVFTLVVTNTGNVNADLSFLAGATPSADVQLPDVYLPLPPASVAFLPVTVRVGSGGTYLIDVTANAGAVQDADTATLKVNVGAPPEPGPVKLYLPVITRNHAFSTLRQPLAVQSVDADWEPPSLTVTDTLTTTFTLAVTNTGSVTSTFQLTVSGGISDTGQLTSTVDITTTVPQTSTGSLESSIESDGTQFPLAPGESMRVPVAVEVSEPGTYPFEVTVSGTYATTIAAATLTVVERLAADQQSDGEGDALAGGDATGAGGGKGAEEPDLVSDGPDLVSDGPFRLFLPFASR